MQDTHEDPESPPIVCLVQTADRRLLEVLLDAIEDIDFNDSVRSSIRRLRNLEGAMCARSFRDDGEDILRDRQSHRCAQVSAIAKRRVRNLFPLDMVGALVGSNGCGRLLEEILEPQNHQLQTAFGMVERYTVGLRCLFRTTYRTPKRMKVQAKKCRKRRLQAFLGRSCWITLMGGWSTAE